MCQRKMGHTETQEISLRVSFKGSWIQQDIEGPNNAH